MQLPEIGDVIVGKYEVVEVLGEGGFGRVYRAVEQLTSRDVAVKVVKPGRAGFELTRIRRFMRELRAIAKLQSPYTLTLFDYGRTEHDLLFMVTEFVPGEDLQRVLARRGALSERETAHIVMQVLQSLTEAHELGTLHRDIKPSNIRVFEVEGDPLRVKVLDFGLARSIANDEVRLTGTGKVIGTPRYMAPEQLRGQELSPQTDVYSVGLVAFDALFGRNARELGQPTLPQPGEELSKAMHVVLSQMLHPEPSQRWDADFAFRAIRACRTELSKTPNDLRSSAPQTLRTTDALPSTVEDSLTTPAQTIPQVPVHPVQSRSAGPERSDPHGRQSLPVFVVLFLIGVVAAAQILRADAPAPPARARQNLPGIIASSDVPQPAPRAEPDATPTEPPPTRPADPDASSNEAPPAPQTPNPTDDRAPPMDGLELWMRAEDVAANGERVTHWGNRGRSALAFKAVTARAPTLVSTAIDGQPALRFEGRQEMRSTREIRLRTGTVFIVAKNDHASHTGQLLSNCGAGGNNQFRYERSGLFFYAHHYPFSLHVATAAPTTDFALLSARLESRRMDVWQDNVLLQTSPISGTGSWNIGQIGARCSSEFLHGQVAEILAYDRALTDREMQRAWRYLRAKYPSLP